MCDPTLSTYQYAGEEAATAYFEGLILCCRSDIAIVAAAARCGSLGRWLADWDVLWMVEGVTGVEFADVVRIIMDVAQMTRDIETRHFLVGG